jgi:hypothetical protein
MVFTTSSSCQKKWEIAPGFTFCLNVHYYFQARHLDFWNYFGFKIRCAKVVDSRDQIGGGEGVYL